MFRPSSRFLLPVLKKPKLPKPPRPATKPIRPTGLPPLKPSTPAAPPPTSPPPATKAPPPSPPPPKPTAPRPRQRTPLPDFNPDITPEAPKPRSKAPLYIGGLFLYSGIVYGIYLLLVLPSSSSEFTPKPLSEQSDTRGIYDSIAKKYDSEISSSEFFMGLSLLRRSLGKRMKGDVLEASAGTGRNVKWYPLRKGEVKSVTLVDTSRPMLEIAEETFSKQFPDFKEVRFLVQDAVDEVKAPGGGQFDVVIQSMGICSHYAPVELLRALGKACRSDGTVILLEHGKSHYEWLNRILDRYADKHAETWGCWWNRDVEEIVRESGLEVVKISRYHFGTTYWIEAKPAAREVKK